MSISEILRRDQEGRLAHEIHRAEERKRQNAAMTAVLAAFDVALKLDECGEADVQDKRRAADRFRDLANHASSVALELPAGPARHILSAFLHMARLSFDLTAEREQAVRARVAAQWSAQMLRIERVLG